MTYFIPSNIIVYYMNKLGDYSSNSLMHYLLVVIFGLLLIIGFIMSEALMIEKLSPQIVKMLKNIY